MKMLSEHMENSINWIFSQRATHIQCSSLKPGHAWSTSVQ
jgi:hypothetical protein